MDRITRLIIAQGGSIYRADSGGLLLVPGGENVLRSDVPVSSAVAFGKLYYADGQSYVVYDGWANSVSPWTASAGNMPSDSEGNTGRLVSLYRGRIIVSGIYGDPHNWHASAIDNPTDFDTSPANPTEAVAVSGNNSVVGLVGDVITGTAALNDDVFVFGGDHSIYALVGDPAAGGRIDLISDVTGMAWDAWAKDRSGALWWFGQRGGVYRLAADPRTGGLGQIEPMSGAIENLLRDVNPSTNIINLLWDDRAIGMHLFITPSDGTTGNHYFFDARSNAWFRDSFPDVQQPTAVWTYDADLPADRAGFLGGYDGHVRKFLLAADDDDGTAINSYVLIGPIQLDAKHVLMSELRGVFSTGSNDVTYELLYGDSPEAALASTARETGTLSAGRNSSKAIRASAQTFFLKLSNNTLDESWAIERIQAVLKPMGAGTHRYQDGD